MPEMEIYPKRLLNLMEVTKENYKIPKKVFDNSIIEFFKLNRKNKENKDSDKG